MVRTLAIATLVSTSLSSHALAQDQVPPVTAAQVQIRERMATALFDLCLPATNGADFDSSPVLTALGSPMIETPDWDPEERMLKTDDGVEVTRYDRTACGVEYPRPPEEDVGGGDALTIVFERLEAPGSGWVRRDEDGIGPMWYDSTDFRHYMEIETRTDSVVVNRYLNPPEAVRAYFEAIARSDGRSAPEAIVEAVDACAAYVSDNRLWEDLEATEIERELSTLSTLTVSLGPAGPKLRGNLDTWLTLDGAECSLEVVADPEDGRYLDRMQTDVIALLTSPGSQWRVTGTSSWTRSDGARVTLGDRVDDRQTWILVPAT